MDNDVVRSNSILFHVTKKSQNKRSYSDDTNKSVNLNISTIRPPQKIINTNIKVAFKAYNGKFVCADKGLNGEIIANRSSIGSWETFEFILLGGNKVALKSSYGKYVSADLGMGGKLFANRDRIGSWEKFEIINLGGGKIALKASNGKFVSADKGLGNILIANRDKIGEWETFYKVKR